MTLIVQVIEVLCQEADPVAARQELQSQFDTVDQLYEELLNGVLILFLLRTLSSFNALHLSLLHRHYVLIG